MNFRGFSHPAVNLGYDHLVKAVQLPEQINKKRTFSPANYFQEVYSFPELAGISQSTDTFLNILYDEINFINIQRSVKIAAVRHPLARLQSCWRDKFSYWGTDDEKTGVKHDKLLSWLWSGVWENAKTFETEKTLATKKPGNIVSFEAFLSYITTSKNSFELLKPGLTRDHWRPISVQCKQGYCVSV